MSPPDHTTYSLTRREKAILLDFLPNIHLAKFIGHGMKSSTDAELARLQGWGLIYPIAFRWWTLTPTGESLRSFFAQSDTGQSLTKEA